MLALRGKCHITMGLQSDNLTMFSNAMGKKGDPYAVVNSKDEVFGVQRLRIVDISAFLLLSPGYTQANVCMFHCGLL